MFDKTNKQEYIENMKRTSFLSFQELLEMFCRK